MDDELYVRFENKFRGTRELIKERVSVYLPIIEPLKTIYLGGLVIDLGCGRGEWLELLREQGWQALGVDTNRIMVDMCKELGLSAVAGDAIRYLGTVKSESVSVVSGFHIAEHLHFDLLVELVKEAHRVLLPGGILILETPNPENYQVGALTFYLDPTHHNPLPPTLMQFVVEDLGFSKSLILRLNGPKQSISADISWTLFANPDYGLVAQKQKSANMPKFRHFDSIQSEHIDFLAYLSDSVNRFISDLSRMKDELNWVKGELNGVKSELNEVNSELNKVAAELSDMKHSLSWRITRPLRQLKQGIRYIQHIYETMIKSKPH